MCHQKSLHLAFSLPLSCCHCSFCGALSVFTVHISIYFSVSYFNINRFYFYILNNVQFQTPFSQAFKGQHDHWCHFEWTHLMQMIDWFLFLNPRDPVKANTLTQVWVTPMLLKKLVSLLQACLSIKPACLWMITGQLPSIRKLTFLCLTHPINCQLHHEFTVAPVTTNPAALPHNSAL